MTEGLTLEYLKREDTVLRLVLDSIFDGVYIVDRDRRIIFWNHGSETITGYGAADVVGRRCSDNILNHIDENGRLLCTGHCPLAHAMDTGTPVEAKVYPLHRSGKRFPVLTHVAPLRDEHGHVIAGVEVFRDISKDEEFRILQEKFDRLVQRYVSHTTYEEIVAQAGGDVEAGARERDLTIFYMDIVGFTPLSEHEPPEAVVRMLNDVFGMCDVITREKHGDIDKFIGDAVMAVFIDANDAVEAAEEVRREALPCFNDARREMGLEPIRVRMGINSGVVVQGEVGTTDRKDLTVIGDVVNTAQRVESACEPGGLLISETTHARLSKDLADRFVFHGEVRLKGRHEPVQMYAARP